MGTDQDASFRWALAGYGAGGRTFHRPLISSATGLELVAVVTGSPERQAQVRAELPGATPVGGLADLAALGVQGVTITTPTSTHAALAHEALELGLHVVVDKPFALTAADARELVEHAAGSACVITPYQNRRWDSDLLTLRRLIADGALGEVHRFTSRIDRFRPVKGSWHGGTVADGGGTLLDLGPHLIDQALHLFGPVTAVHAELRTIRDGAGAEDEVELHLTHAGGVRSTLAAGMASAAPGPRFQVNGAARRVRHRRFRRAGGAAQSRRIAGVPRALTGASSRSRPGDCCTPGAAPIGSRASAAGWDTYYPAVARAMAGDGLPPVDPKDAVATATVLDAARDSAAADVVILLS